MNNKIIGTNGVCVTQVVQDAFNSNFIVSLDDDIFNKIVNECDRKVDISHLNSIKDEIDEKIESVIRHTTVSYFNLFDKLEKENKELRKIIAKLNSRVNDLIAEKQVKEFYEKYSNNYCISRVWKDNSI